MLVYNMFRVNRFFLWLWLLWLWLLLFHSVSSYVYLLFIRCCTAPRDCYNLCVRLSVLNSFCFFMELCKLCFFKCKAF
ncbi:hypothetical protein BC01_210 [Bacillus phage BC01]|nr:hypothetical protein BC01_210 [Bacillus phage BC01]